MPQFRTLGIVGKQGDPEGVYAALRQLLNYLHDRALGVLLDTVSARALGAPDGIELAELGARADLIVAVGGDGTLLHAARAVAAWAVPLMGINLGRLGFLADVSPDAIEPVLDRILAGEYECDTRAMLLARTGAASEDADGASAGRAALNDVVIHKWNSARMIEFEIWIDGVFVYDQRSDGLIVATPTGSTAYALSGGGPLVDPALDAILLVPICPHDLSNRPLVIPGDRRIEVRVRDADRAQARIACDGQPGPPLPASGRIQVVRHPDRVRLLHPRGHDHYRLLRAKLGWGGHFKYGRRRAERADAVGVEVEDSRSC